MPSLCASQRMPDRAKSRGSAQPLSTSRNACPGLLSLGTYGLFHPQTRVTPLPPSAEPLTTLYLLSSEAGGAVALPTPLCTYAYRIIPNVFSSECCPARMLWVVISGCA